MTTQVSTLKDDSDEQKDDSNEQPVKSILTLKGAMIRYRKAFALVGLFSIFTNLLMLVSPMYMLQIYDRVLTSASTETLIALTTVALFLLAIFGLLEWVRHRLMARISQSLSFDIADDTLYGVFQARCNQSELGSGQPVRDLDMVRQFLSGPTVFAFFDAPWIPVFTAVVFLINPILGWIALFGGLTLLILALLTEITSSKQIRKAADESTDAQRFVLTTLQHSEILRAMGMFDRMRGHWRENYDDLVSWQAAAGDRVSILLAASKAFRFALQVGILGAGAYLALQQQITLGMIIGASIIMGRALAPIEMAISAWRGFVAARASGQRLSNLLTDFPRDTSPQIHLPRPRGEVEVERLLVVPPGGLAPVLHGLNLTLEAGSLTGVIGASGSGKSTLGRVLIGVWPATSGTVRLDGASIHTWPDEIRARHMGYLPQEFALFPGTVAQNIARMEEVVDAKVLEAARLARCHDMIMRLPQNYNTVLSASGAPLSTGQRQRVAFARALYDDPAYVVLDEPDANLDTEGQEALLAALQELRSRDVTVVLIAHNRRPLEMARQVLALKNGVLVASGPLRNVLAGKPAPASAG